MTTSAAASRPAIEPPGRRRGAIAEGLTLALVLLVMLRGLAPGQVFSNVLPWGGDQVGFPVLSWVIQHQVLPSLHGWSDAWFSGFPVNQLYPMLPATLVALLSYVMPLAVAYKLVTVLSALALPMSAWGAARLVGLRRPYPALFAVFTLPFYFDTSCTVCGGTSASLLGGEFSFQLGLALSVLALAKVHRLARSGRGSAGTAVLFAVAALSHPLTAAWLLVGTVTTVVIARPWRDRARRRAVGITALLALLLTAWWWIPFLALHGWMTNQDFARRGDLGFWMFPGHWWSSVLFTGLAVAGAVLGVRRRRGFVLVLVVLTVVAGFAFVTVPEGQVWNLRVLPFWLLGRWLLVAAALAEISFLLEPVLVARGWNGPRPSALVAPVSLVVTALLVAASWGWIPGTVTTKPTVYRDGAADVLGLHLGVTRLSAWPHAVLSGYESRPDYPELQGVQAMMDRAATTRGCGRLSWDSIAPSFPDQSAFGDDQVLFRLPMWTHGCITTTSGTLYDSSASTTEALLTESLVSQLRDQWKPGLPYQHADLFYGVRHLKEIGDRYYLTYGGPEATAAGQKGSGLTLVDSSGRWQLWEVDGWSTVQPLTIAPEVVVPDKTTSWQKITQGYSVSNSWSILELAQDGPADWIRAPAGAVLSPNPLPPATVSNVRMTHDSVSFDIDHGGVPVLVKVSDFPGWKVSGALGPWRSASNYLLVIPTKPHVVIARSTTAGDVVADVVLVAGLALVPVVALRERRRRRSGDGAPETSAGGETAVARPRAGRPA